MEQSVPKRRHIKFRRRGITQKETYNIQNTAKVWNQVKLLLHQTESLYNQRLEVNWWQAERQACIPRRFCFITQETVNKMYESYRRIILKRDKKKRAEGVCVNTEENKKLGVSSFTSFYLFSLKAATGHLPWLHGLELHKGSWHSPALSTFVRKGGGGGY